MPSNLLILPLLAGYCFLHILAFTSYRAQRLDGHRLILESALLAIVLTAIGRLLALGFAQINWVNQAWLSLAPRIEYLGTGILSIVAGATIPFALNRLAEATDKFPRVRRLLGKCWVFSNRRAIFMAMQRHGSELHRLLYRALDEERQVSITLDNKKVYIGYVYGAPKLEPHDAYVALIPLLSGYRDTASLGLKLTQDYLTVYESEPALKKENFVVVLPLSQIRIASFFDQTAHSRFEILKEGSSDELDGSSDVSEHGGRAAMATAGEGGE
jgi:hypothetical protein